MSLMDEVFIIMQIGDSELDQVCDEAMVFAISDAGFEARRVDRHNAGDLLKSEIVQFIERSQIIVADVTNERPNCYLEIGYAMGLGKKANLILTAREDHYHDSPNYQQGGPKIHFDLAGYDILFWDPADLPAFRSTLARRIERRARMVHDSPTQDTRAVDTEWRDPLRQTAEGGLNGVGGAGYMEVSAEIQPLLSTSQKDLIDALRSASVSTFGWPIGIVLQGNDERRPRPTSDGAIAEIAYSEEDPLGRISYDYWKAFRDGRFYTLLSLFEDDRAEQKIFFDTRINRVTEALMLLARLYRRLEASDTDRIIVRVRHGGLAGRTLGAASSLRAMWHHGEASENVVETSVSASLGSLKPICLSS